MSSTLDICLVAMPWMSLHFPSIQLGILKPLLARAGLKVATRTASLDWIEYLLKHTASDADPFRLEDYSTIAHKHHLDGIGDWIFGLPATTGRDQNAPEQPYEVMLRRKGVDERLLKKALTAKALAPDFLSSLATSILEREPRVVGFTMVFSQTLPSLALARLLKERKPQIRIVCGGANCDGIMGEAVLRLFPYIDVVVRGEAEHVAPPLFRALIDGIEVPELPGVCFRSSLGTIQITPTGARQQVPMDSVPTPDYDDYFTQLRSSPVHSAIFDNVCVPIETSRGCWWGEKAHCTFCGLNKETMAFRSKQPQMVLADIEHLSRRHRNLRFVTADNILDLSYLTSVLDTLAKGRHDVELFFETKANLNRAQVKRLKEAGVNAIQPGIESLSTAILRLMRKGTTAMQNVTLLKWCAYYGIHVNWNIIVGTPGEEEAEYQRMADLSIALAHLPPPQISVLSMDRFSPYQQRPEQFGLVVTGPKDFYQYAYGLRNNELMDLAYSFEFAYKDGREPLTYAGPLLDAVEQWHADSSVSLRALIYRRGLDFVVIDDMRKRTGRRSATLRSPEGALYLACEAPQTVAAACSAAGLTHDVDTEARVRDFFDRLVAESFMCHLDGRYLALALPTREDTAFDIDAELATSPRIMPLKAIKSEHSVETSAYP